MSGLESLSFPPEPVKPKPAKPKPNPLDPKVIKAEINTRALKALTDRFADGRVEAEVHALLSRGIGSIVAANLGLRKDTWKDTYEVDHSNGRNSPLATQVHAYAEKDIAAALEEHRADFKSLLPRGWEEAVKKEYQAAVLAELRDQVREKVKEMARLDAEKIICDALGVALPNIEVVDETSSSRRGPLLDPDNDE
jgi:hypothetical protein